MQYTCRAHAVHMPCACSAHAVHAQEGLGGAGRGGRLEQRSSKSPPCISCSSAHRRGTAPGSSGPPHASLPSTFRVYVYVTAAAAALQSGLSGANSISLRQPDVPHRPTLVEEVLEVAQVGDAVEVGEVELPELLPLALVLVLDLDRRPAVLAAVAPLCLPKWACEDTGEHASYLAQVSSGGPSMQYRLPRPTPTAL